MFDIDENITGPTYELSNYSHKKNLIRTITQLNLVNDAVNPLNCLDCILDAENFLKRTISEFKRDLKREEQK